MKNTDFLFAVMSLIIKLSINWLGIKTLLFLFRKKEAHFLLFNRMTSKCFRNLPCGPVVLCSRFYPKKIELLKEAFFRGNCVVVDWYSSFPTCDLLYRLYVAEAQQGRSLTCDMTSREDLEDYYRNLATSFTPETLDLSERSGIRKLIHRYKIANLFAPFDSHIPILALIEECHSVGINTHIMQHGIMFYPYRDFLKGDYFYVFSSTLKNQLYLKGFNRNQTTVISEYLDLQHLQKLKGENQKTVFLESLYLITTANPIFFQSRIKTSYCELVFLDFLKLFSQLILNREKQFKTIEVACHPSEQCGFYKDTLRDLNLDWKVRSSFDSIKHLKHNPIFIDLHVSTLSHHLVYNGGKVFRYMPNSESRNQITSSNFVVFDNLTELVLSLRRALDSGITINEPVVLKESHNYPDGIRNWICSANPQEKFKVINYH